MTQSKYYKEFNPNPLGKEVDDCQIRSLCAVTGKSWYEIFDLLTAYGRKTATILGWEDVNNSYHIDLFGMIKHKLKREKGKKAMTVEKFCQEHPTGRYVLRLANHQMGIVNGEYYELYAGWDKATVYTYWEYNDNAKPLESPKNKFEKIKAIIEMVIRKRPHSDNRIFEQILNILNARG